MADVIDTSEFRNGLKILLDNEPYVIVEFQHVKPGKGSAVVRTRYKSLISGRVLEKNFKSGDRWAGPTSRRRRCSTSTKRATITSSWIRRTTSRATSTRRGWARRRTS